MSTTIDQQVVEMRFDNRQFESNVSTTMSTLDKLKQKLQFDGASKGLENVNSAARKVDMSVLSNGAEAVRVKFSALEVAGVTALANITNSAVNAGKNLVKSLSVDQIASGWNKYGQKTASVQTIMNATGKSIDEVNQYLDKLMWFSDETSYGFTDMTAALGQMTSAGGNIDKLIPLITGVANATAFAGKGASEFSRVMYNLNQSYGAGFLQYMDWRSIDLAGVSSKQLKQTFIDVGKELGKITDDEVNLANFATTLKDKWADTEVMEKAFGRFAEMSEKAYEMVKAGEVDTASEAYEILSKKYDGVAITAAKAAQEAKTFTEAIDATKDAVSSGWMRTFELIFGNYDEAKVMWTDLANILWDMFAAGSEDRNAFLADALDSNWDKLIRKINEAGIETTKFEDSIEKVVGGEKLSGLIEEYGSLEEVIRGGAISSEDLKKALEGVTSPDLSIFVDGLKEIDRMLRRGNTGEDVKKLQTALKELGYELGTFGENGDGLDGIIGPVTEKAIKDFQAAHGLLVDGIAGPETMAALKKAGEELGQMTGDVDELLASCDSLIDVITNPGGRELLFESLMNVLQAIQRPINAVKEAFSNVFSLTPTNLYHGLQKLNKFTKSLISGGILDSDSWTILTDRIKSAGIETDAFSEALTNALKENDVNVDELIEKYGSLGKAFEEGAISTDIIRDVLLSFEGISETLVDSGETIDKIRRSFEGLFAAIDVVATVVSGPAKIAFKTITNILKHFGLGILDVTANFGDSIVEFRDKVDSVVNVISEFIAEHVTKWVDKFKETEIFKNVAGWFSDAGDKISGVLSGITDKVDDFNLTPLGKGLKTVADFVSSVGQRLSKSKIVTFAFDAIKNAFTGLKNFFAKFKLPEFSLDNVRTFLSNIISVSDNMMASGKGGIAGVLSGVGTTLKAKFVTPQWTKIQTNLEAFFADFVAFWLKVGDKIKAAFEIGKEVAKSIVKFLFGTEEIDLPTIMAAVEKFLWIVTLYKAIQLMDNVVAPFETIGTALNNFAGSLKWQAISGALKSMALVLGVLTVCIILLASIPDINKAAIAAGLLAGLMIVMGAVIATLGILAGKFGGLDVKGAFALATSLLMLVGAIALMVYALKEIDELKLRNPIGTFTMLGAIILALAAGIRIIGKAGGSTFKSVAAILTLVAALKLMLEVIEAYDKFPWAGTSKGIMKMVEMLLLLSLSMRIVAGGLKGDANFKGLALALLAMVLSLKLMLNVIKDIAGMGDDEIDRGITVIAKLMAIMAIFIAVANLTSQCWVVEKGQKGMTSFSGFALALLAVVAAIWVLGKMPMDVLEQGIEAVSRVLLMFTAMMFVVGQSCSGLKTGPIIAALIGFAVLLVEMTIITKVLDSVSWQSKLSTMVALGGVLLAMAAVLKILSTQQVNAKAIYKWIGALAVLGLIVVGLAVILRSMKDLNPLTSIGNAVALSAILLAMAGCLRILTMHRNRPETIKRWVGALAGLALVVFALAAVLYTMNDLDPLTSIGNAVALGILLGVMAGVVTILSKFKVSGNLTPAILAIAALGAVVLELGFVLSLIKQWDMTGMEREVLVLSSLLVVLTGVMAACVALGLISSFSAAGMAGCILGIALLGLVVYELGIVLSEIRKADMSGMEDEVMVLSALLVVLTGVMAACVALGLISSLSIGGMAGCILGIALLGLVIYELGIVLSELKKADMSGMEKEAMVLSALLVVLTGVMAACVALGLISTFSAGGMAGCILGIALLGLVIYELGIVLAELKKADMSGMEDEAMVLASLLVVLTGVMAVLTVIGFAAPAAITGVGIMIVFIGALTELVTTIGRIMSDPDLQKFLDTGIEMLKKLAKGIGEIISEFGVGLTSGLPAIGENLSKFAENLGTFITTMNSVDDGLVDRAKKLGEAVLALTGSNFLDSITSLFDKNKDGGSLSNLGNELSDFASNASDFIAAMDGMKPETATSIDSFCGAVESLNNVCGNNNFGDGALTALGSTMETFAGNMKNVAISLKDLTDDDVANIERAATAGKALAELNEAIPREGGDWQNFAGSQDLASWGEKISAFADSLVAYSYKVSGKNLDTDAIKKSAEAASAISELNDSLPSSGGTWQEWTGEQSLATWGQTLVPFGQALVDYSSIVSGQNIDPESIKTSAAAAAALVEVCNAIEPNVEVLWGLYSSEIDYVAFGAGLSALATGIANYAKVAENIDESTVESIEYSGTALDKIIEVVNKVPKIGFDWGSGINDPKAVGDGILALAKGVRSYCSVAATITQEDVDAITFSKNAVIALSDVVNNVPEIDQMNALNLKSAAAYLQDMCITINTISLAGYDFSSIDTLKTMITKLNGIVSDDEASSIKTRFSNVNSAMTEVSRCSSSLVDLNGTTYGGVDVLKGALNSLAEANVDGVINAFSGKAETMAASVSALVNAMASGFTDNSDKVTSSATTVVNNAINAVKSTADTFRSTGSDLIAKLLAGMLDKTEAVFRAAQGLGQQAPRGARTNYSYMASAGRHLGAGLVYGIEQKYDDAYNAGYALGQKAVQGEKDGQASESPSKLTIQAGKWLGEGLVIGMDKMGGKVYKAGHSLGETATSSLSSTISRISEAVSSDIDAQPTIRPVLDLSDVRSGIGTMSSMLDMDSSIGVRTNIGAISSMMNSRSQNGANDDVVSELAKLRKDIGNMSNTTYQVNGVTYDDGSNITDAVRTLVRAAKIEGRV